MTFFRAWGLMAVEASRHKLIVGNYPADVNAALKILSWIWQNIDNNRIMCLTMKGNWRCAVR
jgi:hypothetical protein